MKPKLLIITTASISLHVLHKGFYKYFSNFYKIYGLTGDSTYVKELQKQKIEVTVIAMEREISLFKDIRSFINLSFFLVSNRFDIIHYSTFKASLMGSIAAKISFQNKSLYTVRGRVYENYSGFKLWFFKLIEKIICAMSNLVIPISKELGEDMIKKQICPKSKIRFIANGSSNGINTEYFENKSESYNKRQLQKGFNLDPDKITIGFLGRVRQDKGIEDLVIGFKILNKKYSNVQLLIGGPEETASTIDKDVTIEIAENENIIKTNGYVEARVFYQVIDIFSFPSHREGFGNVALEASSMNLPIVGTNIMGIREAIQDKVTGYLFEKGNVEDIASKLELLIQSEKLRNEMGEQGRQRIVEKFNNLIVWKGINEVYRELLMNN